MLTVRDLTRELKLDLLAGEEAAEAPLRWVHISELADPTPWLSGGELLLTTGMVVGDEQAQRAYVERLADHGVAGLGFGTGIHHDEVPDAIRETAVARNLPLFCIPYELPFIAITERAFTQLVNEQYAVLRRSIAAIEATASGSSSRRNVRCASGTPRPSKTSALPPMSVDSACATASRPRSESTMRSRRSMAAIERRSTAYCSLTSWAKARSVIAMNGSS